MPHVSVSIPVRSTWPSREELVTRDSVISALEEAGIGQNTGAGGGRGMMDFSFVVDDEIKARAEIDQAMNGHMPGKAFTVTVCQ